MDPSIDDLVVREDIVDVEPLWMNWQVLKKDLMCGCGVGGSVVEVSKIPC